MLQMIIKTWTEHWKCSFIYWSFCAFKKNYYKTPIFNKLLTWIYNLCIKSNHSDIGALTQIPESNDWYSVQREILILILILIYIDIDVDIDIDLYWYSVGGDFDIDIEILIVGGDIQVWEFGNIYLYHSLEEFSFPQVFNLKTHQQIHFVEHFHRFAGSFFWYS